jgi:hypothetical protein
MLLQRCWTKEMIKTGKERRWNRKWVMNCETYCPPPPSEFYTNF